MSSVTRTFLISLATVLILAGASVYLSEGADAEPMIFDDGSFEYSIEDGKAHICGTVTFDFGTDMVVPDTVTHDAVTYDVVGIQLMSIMDLPGVETVTLGANITYVANINFVWMADLKTVVFDAALSELGEACFDACPSLTQIVGNSYFDFEGGCLYRISSNTLVRVIGAPSGAVTVRDGTVALGSYSASSCAKLTSISLPNSILSIDEGAFNGCGMLSAVTTRGIGDGQLPDRLLYIGLSAFNGCISLENLTLPKSLNVMGACAFLGSGLKSVCIPRDITYIGEGAFARCPNLASVTVEEGCILYKAIDGILFEVTHEGKDMTLHTYPGGKAVSDGKYVVPKDVNSIRSMAFYGNDNIREVVLSGKIAYMESCVFYECTSLEKINIPSSITSIPSDAFGGCESLRSITLESGLIEIGDYAFSGCTSLEAVELPSTVRVLSDGCFASCQSMKTMKLPAGVIHLGTMAFYDSGLESLYIEGTSVQFEELALQITETFGSRVLKVECSKNLVIPANAYGAPGEIETVFYDDRPYPYENWIAIAICVLILFGTIRYIRRV